MMVKAQGRAIRVAVRDGVGIPLLICNGIGGSLLIGAGAFAAAMRTARA